MTTKTLHQQYRIRAHKIGDNAVKLVDDFFRGGIHDEIETSAGRSFTVTKIKQWTIDDLDRVLDVMERAK